MKKKYLLILHITCLLSIVSCGGSKNIVDKSNPKTLILQAIQQTRNSNYEEALKLYQKTIDLDPLIAEAYARRGSLLYTLGRKYESISDLKRSIELDPEFNMELYYSTGINSFDIGNYKDAIFYFKEYQARVEKSSDKTMKMQDYINVAKIRQELKDNAVEFVPVKLGDEINTGTLEYLPSLTADGKTMIFTRRLNNQEDLYSAVKDGEVWGNVEPIEDINTFDNEGGQTISKDGKTIIFTACNYKNGFGSCDLYISTFENDHWSKPNNLGEEINSRSWEAHPCLNADGTILYFSSDRPGGYGARDIWVSQKNAKGEWTNPVNAGEKVNGKYSEESPFIHIDGHTLYLRSDRIEGMGSFDIFYTKRINRAGKSVKTFTWSELVNLGYPINTEGNEGALYIEQDGITGYFASDIDSRNSNQRAPDLDIYTFSIPSYARATPTSFIQGKITDGKSDIGLNATYKVINLKDGEVLHTGNSQANGTVFMALSSGDDYAIIVEKEGYDYYSVHFDASVNTKSDAMYMDILLSPIVETNQKAIVLDNIFFKTGSAILDTRSNIEIKQLASFLKSNSNLKITILGHTDDVGEEEANQILSEERAKTVYDELIKSGIDAIRMTYEGKGELHPLVKNDSNLNRERNRRTEFMIIENN